MLEPFVLADIIGIIAFTTSGFLTATKNNLDILGILILSSLTALGGGIIRDAILNTPPFAFTSMYPVITLLITLSIIYGLKIYKKNSVETKWIFVLSDTIGLVAFSITGALLAIGAEFNFFGIVVLSFITAVGGGVTRDILINQVPNVLRSDFYGSIAIITALLLSLFEILNILSDISILVLAFCMIILRVIAYKRNWHLPRLS